MKHLVLIGLMGSGKSTLGKKIANSLDYVFMDTDQIIEQKEGKSINQLFEEKGEFHFRTLEHQLLKSLKEEQSPMVIATGGGLPCFNDNMILLNEIGVTFYLDLKPGLLAQRLMQGKQKRPLLKDLSHEEVVLKLSTLLIEREDYYKKSNFCLPLEAQNLKQITELYLKAIQ